MLVLINYLIQLCYILFQVTEEYQLVPDTLYLAVNLIDRFLSQRLVTKQTLQLLGITCMLISS
jgi:cyclin A